MSNITLSDIADITGILSFIGTLIAWLVTKKRFSSWWQRWSKYVFVFLAILVILIFTLRGWFDWLFSDLKLPVWLIILIGILGFVFIGFFIIIKRLFLKEKDYLKYKKDKMDGINWQWDYIGDNIARHTITPFCPNVTCSCRLMYSEFSAARCYGYLLEFVCPNCNFKKSFNLYYDDYIKTIALRIEGQIRTGQYKQKIDA